MKRRDTLRGGENWSPWSEKGRETKVSTRALRDQKNPHNRHCSRRCWARDHVSHLTAAVEPAASVFRGGGFCAGVGIKGRTMVKRFKGSYWNARPKKEKMVERIKDGQGRGPQVYPLAPSFEAHLNLSLASRLLCGCSHLTLAFWRFGTNCCGIIMDYGMRLFGLLFPL